MLLQEGMKVHIKSDAPGRYAGRDARVLRIETADAVVVLPQGLTNTPDHRIYYTEKHLEWVQGICANCEGGIVEIDYLCEQCRAHMAE